jgi:hypothetical protein
MLFREVNGQGSTADRSTKLPKFAGSLVDLSDVPPDDGLTVALMSEAAVALMGLPLTDFSPRREVFRVFFSIPSAFIEHGDFFIRQVRLDDKRFGLGKNREKRFERVKAVVGNNVYERL